jgi:hypothetical protein
MLALPEIRAVVYEVRIGQEGQEIEGGNSLG